MENLDFYPYKVNVNTAIIIPRILLNFDLDACFIRFLDWFSSGLARSSSVVAIGAMPATAFTTVASS